MKKYGGNVRSVPPRWESVRWVIDLLIQYVMETYEKYPTLAEFHWGGAHRVSTVGALAASVAALITGSSVMGVQAQHYAIGLLLKEGWLRTGWAGQEVAHHAGTPFACSLRMEEGVLPELRGMNYPLQSYTAGHSPGFVGACSGSAFGRGHPFSTSAVIKIAFADPDLAFDFRHPRKEIARGALGQFEPQGERYILFK
jgi:methyl-coenzyme M reductase alpha subunit